MHYVFITAANSSKKKEPKVFKKGDRIVVAVDDDCFLGTVTRVANGKIYLLFDDEDTGKVSVGSKRILGEGINRKVKKSFSKKDAKKYIKPSVVKVPRLRDTPRVRPNAPSRETPAAQDSPAAETKQPETKPKPRRASKPFAPTAVEDKAPRMDDYSDKLEYIAALWEFYNAKYFNGRMKKPKFLLKKNVDPLKVKGLGQYHFKFYRDGDHITVIDSNIKISPFMFRDEVKCGQVLLHEMCHQAVAELDRLDDGHGDAWAAWAKRCGIKASRLTNASDLFNDEEKQEIQRNADRNKSILDTASRGNVNVDKFTLGMPCKLYSMQDKNHVAGRLVYLLPSKVRIVTLKDNKYVTWTVDKRLVFESDDDGGVSKHVADAFIEYEAITSKRNVKGLAREVRDSVALENLRVSISLDSVEKDSTPIDKKDAAPGDPCFVVIKGKRTNCRIVKKFGEYYWVVFPIGRTFNVKRFHADDVTMLSSNSLSLISRCIPGHLVSEWEEHCELAEREPNSFESQVSYYAAIGEGFEFNSTEIPNTIIKEIVNGLSPFKLPTSERVEGAAVTTIDNDGHVVIGRIGCVRKNGDCIVIYKHKRNIGYVFDTEYVYKPVESAKDISKYINDDLVSACADYFEAGSRSGVSQDELTELKNLFYDYLALARREI